MQVKTASWKLPSEPLYRRHILNPPKSSRTADLMRSLSLSFSLEVRSLFQFVALMMMNQTTLPSLGSLHTRTWAVGKKRSEDLSQSLQQGLNLRWYQTIEDCLT